MAVRIQNRPLTYSEKMKFDPNEREVIFAYEKHTKQKFMRFDVIILKRLIKLATPEQINSQIKRFAYHEKYKNNFTFFGYIEPPVKNQFKNRRGGKKNENK